MLDKEEYIRKFREMWNWIADKTEERKTKVCKREYFIYRSIQQDEIPNMFCYLCEYASQKNKEDMLSGVDVSTRHVCLHCPVQWNENFFMTCNQSLYRSWNFTEDTEWETAANLARQIANLPEREDV